MDERTAQQAAELSPDLVRRVTDEVYKLLLQDLKRERERMGAADVRTAYGLTSSRRGVG